MILGWNTFTVAEWEGFSEAHGIILESADGTRWRMGVSNAGATTWTDLT